MRTSADDFGSGAMAPDLSPLPSRSVLASAL